MTETRSGSPERRFPAWCGVAALLLLTACSAPQTRLLREGPASSPAVQVSGVPFFPQQDFQCGPASLAMALSWSGRPSTPEELVPLVFVPGREGSFVVELAAAARQKGRVLYPLSPDLGALLSALADGQPVLILQNNGFAARPLWHFAVVVGVDLSREKLWLHSGRTARLETTFSAFERTWARGGRWAAVVVAPESFSRELDPDVLAREFSLMLRAGDMAAAAAGFFRLVSYWPEHSAARLGLADAERKQGNPAGAEHALRELLRRNPDYGPGLNNLADLLLSAGRSAEALPLAERAVRSLDIPATRATLTAVRDAITSQMRPAP